MPHARGDDLGDDLKHRRLILNLVGEGEVSKLEGDEHEIVRHYVLQGLGVREPDEVQEGAASCWV